MTEMATPIAEVNHLRHRTIWRRFFAGILDALVMLPIVVLEFWIVNEDRPLSLVTLWVGTSYLYFHIYSVWMHARFGQTLGKMATRVKVLDKTESKVPGVKRALVRESVYLALSVLFAGCTISLIQEKGIEGYDEFSFSLVVVTLLGGGWVLCDTIGALVSRKRRALHDLMAGTVVVNLSVSSYASTEVTPSP